MERIIQYKINKYAKYIDNLQWHINTNKPVGKELEYIEQRISDFKQVINDLKELIKIENDHIVNSSIKE